MTEIETPRPYKVGDTLHFSAPEAAPMLCFGFSFREDWGRWTDGPCARIEVSHGLERGLLLVELMVARAFCGEGGTCDLVVEAGWGEPSLFVLGPGPARIAFLVAAEETALPGALTIDLHVSRPKPPNELPDSRALGVGFERLRLSCLQKTAE